MTIVAIVGLGDVGLLFTVEFGKIHETIRFDLSAEKVRSCQGFYVTLPHSVYQS